MNAKGRKRIGLRQDVQPNSSKHDSGPHNKMHQIDGLGPMWHQLVVGSNHLIMPPNFTNINSYYFSTRTYKKRTCRSIDTEMPQHKIH